MTVTAPLLPPWETLAPLLQGALERRWITNQGSLARRLEDALPASLGAAHAVLLTNGTSAIELMLKAVVPATGEEPAQVIVPAWSFVATWNLLCDDPRYEPVFVDIGEGWCIDPAAVEAAITPRTKAILAVHPYGLPCDHDALTKIALRHDLRLLYDAAHTFGARWRGHPMGALGDASAWSFHATKVFSTVEGGAVSTPDPALHERLRRARNFGIVPGEDQVVFGTNAKLDELRAAFGLAVLGLVPDAIAARRRVAHWYDTRLAGGQVPWLRTARDLVDTPELQPNHGYYPVRIAADPGREAVAAALLAAGVHTRPYFGETLFRSTLYRPWIRPDELPQARQAARETLCLPIHHLLTEDDVDHVCTVLSTVDHGPRVSR